MATGMLSLNRFEPTPQPVPHMKYLPREGSEDEPEPDPQKNVGVVYKLRDISEEMVQAWTMVFSEKPYYNTRIQVSQGDIFRDGPAADAIVSPTNSFGFMDGGIDMAYSRHFGWGMSRRLQDSITGSLDGELLVGDAIIIPTNVPGEEEPEIDPDVNEGEPIKWLIAAPTMRVPLDVSHTVNAYLAFRAIILAVRRFNNTPGVDPIQSVICPGLGTAVGKMPPLRCAKQMLRAFETFDQKMHSTDITPSKIDQPWNLHREMIGLQSHH